MSEGTKIGEFKENQDFSAAVKHSDSDVENLKATKMGEVSEFEKSLLAESEAKETTQAPEPSAEQVAERGGHPAQVGQTVFCVEIVRLDGHFMTG